MKNNRIKTGIVSITGNANAGKSTLLNTLLKNKIAITSNTRFLQRR
jgi:GTPase Era involved in 16S rRNA processing